MNLLISNDDGVHASGLLALYKALSEIADVKVVAPSTEQSGCASALNIIHPLYAQTLSSKFIAINGSPADCVYLAVHKLYADIEFDAVITGINSGANLGQDVLFSGTFGAALTAQLFGIPAIATSLVNGATKEKLNGNHKHYDAAAEQIVKLIMDSGVLSIIEDLPYHVLNVNIPEVDDVENIKGYKITRLAHQRIAKPVHHIIDPRGHDAYWLSLRKQPMVNDSIVPTESASTELADTITDAQAVAQGYISLSPVRLHHTPQSSIDKLLALNIAH